MSQSIQDTIEPKDLAKFCSHQKAYADALNEATEINRLITKMNSDIVTINRKRLASEQKLETLRYDN
jgi:hypothetical protein